ncbi:HAMP domain-containing protein [Thermonema lapsum]|uniref:HAMP domain-containing protein n=1 Tax=Thermonema lapsum TaxID=28195 RepID=A0A846MPA1_9BACT|nr:GAF domain-containing protein [Thermonema lapsum]NIK73281.1 HAMP domain-containing protein [Thermonema lapsum]
MKLLNNLPLRLIAVVVAAFSMLLLFAYFATIYYQGIKTKHVNTVAMAVEAGRLADEIAEMVELWATTSDSSVVLSNSADKLEQLRARYATYLEVLQSGGKRTIGKRQKVEIVRVKEAEGLLRELQKDWKELSPSIEWLVRYLSGIPDATQASYDKAWVSIQSSEFARKNDKLRDVYLDWAQKQEYTQYLWFYTLLTLTILLFFVLFVVVRYLLFQPIRQIARVTAQLANGELGVKVTHYNNNEIGAVARNLNRISETLFYASEFAKEIGQGNLDAKYKGNQEVLNNTENNLIAILEQMRQQLKEVARRDQEERWIEAGVAHFASVLRGASNLPLDELAYLIISNLVQYMELQQGAIYFVQEQIAKTSLKLLAAYALNKRRYIDKEFLPGEGLVGQVYRDKSTAYLEDVPPTFDKISSALGAAKPRSALVAPLKLNENVYAVVELMSLHPIPKYKRDFLERVSENLASVILTAKNNERLRKIQQEAEEVEKRIKRRGI